MTSSIHLSYLLEQIPYFQGPFITSWLFFESYCVLVIFNYSVVQGEYGLETLWKETQRRIFISILFSAHKINYALKFNSKVNGNIYSLE